MPDIEHKIIEIISKDFDCCEAECGYCDKLKECSQFTAERIVNLIAQHESALRSENEQLKADLLKEKQRGNAMAEALKLARIDLILHYKRMLPTCAEEQTLAKIDATLPKGEGNEGLQKSA